MLDIKQEIGILLWKKGVRSMRKLISSMKEKGYNIPKSSTMSAQLNKKRIRFQMLEKILDFLGYELVIKEK